MTAEQALTPIQHDGWKSRRAIGSAIAAGVIFIAACALLLVSGVWADSPFFSADNWLSALWIVAVILGVGWGLLSIDKVMELKKLGLTSAKP